MTQLTGEDLAGIGDAANSAPSTTASPPPSITGDDLADIGAAAQGVSPDRLTVNGKAGIVQDPARAAKVLDLSQRTKLPSELVDAHLNDVDAAVRQAGFDADSFRKTSPVLAQWLSEDPAHVGLVRDDLPQMQQLETLVRNSPYYRYLPGGQIVETNRGAPGRTFDSIVDFRKQMNADQLSDTAQEVHEQLLESQLTFFGAHGGWIGRQADQVMAGFAGELAGLGGTVATLAPGMQEQATRDFQSEQQLGAAAARMAPGVLGDLERQGGALTADVPLMLMGGPLAKAAEGIGGLVAKGRALQPILSRMLQGGAAMQPFAARGAIEQGHEQGWESGLESWAIDTGIAGAFGPVGASRAAMRMMGVGGAGAAADVSAPAVGAARMILTQSGLQTSQMAAFALGHAIQQYATGADPHALDWQNLGAQLGSQGLLGGLMGGVFTAPEAFGHAVALSREGQFQDYRRMAAASLFKDHMDQVEATLASTKALTLNQSTIRDTIQRYADAGTTPDMHIDAATWDQHFQDAKQDPAQAARELGVANYNEARATGGQLRVPYGAFATQIANGPHSEWFKANMRERPDAMSDAEQQARLEELKAKMGAKSPAELGGPLMEDETAKEAMVFEDFKRQEIASGVNETVAEHSAIPYAKIVATTAQHVGMDPWQFHQTYGPKVRAAMPELLKRKGPLDAYITNMAARIHAGDIPTEADITNAMDQPPEGALHSGDIIDVVKSLGGIRGRPKGEQYKNAGEYEGRVNHPDLRGTVAPDEMATRLQQEGFGTGSTAEMWDLLAKAAAGRRAAKRAEPTHNPESRRLEEQRAHLLAGQDWLTRTGADIATETPEQLAERIRQGLLPQGELGRSGPAAKGAVYEQSAFHGTGNPNPYDRFDVSKVGGPGGEGAQAYGHGLYFASRKDIAEHYRRQNSRWDREYKIDGKDVRELLTHPGAEITLADHPEGLEPRAVSAAATEMIGRMGQHGYTVAEAAEAVIAHATEEARRIRNYSVPDERMVHDWEQRALAARALVSHMTASTEGRLYHVELPDPHELLDWDKPVRLQSEQVQAAIRTVLAQYPDAAKILSERPLDGVLGKGVYEALSQALTPAPEEVEGAPQGWTNMLRGNEGDRAASETLRAAGIPGHQYLDQGSRSTGRGTHNYVIYDDSRIRITKFEQQAEPSAEDADTPRGSYDALQRLITLEAGADRSTVLHEIGHWALETLTSIAEGENAPPRIVEDVAKLRQWMGLEEGQPYTEAAHEQFARAWERYLMEGVAPSRELRGSFARISRWLAKLYGQARTYFTGVELNPTIRGIFDRLLASDEEIAAAKGKDAPIGAFTNQAEAGMDDATWASYQRNLQGGVDQAQDLLDQEFLAPVRAREEAAYQRTRERMRLQVANQINQQKVYTALLVLQKGAWPEGVEAPEGMERMKLSKQDIVRRFGASGPDLLPGPQRAGEPPKPNAGRVLYTEDARGVDLDTAAQAFGFGSGGELWTALTRAPDRTALIEKQTDAQMAKLHPDPVVDGSAEDSARDALVNDPRFRAMEQEAEAIARQQGRRATPNELLQALARQTIRDSPSAKINPEGYRTAMVRAGRTAAEHIGAKRWAEADKAKEQERMNGYLYRAAREAVNSSAAWKTYLETFSDLKKRQRLGKAGGDEYTVTWKDQQGAEQSKTFASKDYVSDPEGVKGMSPEIADDVMREARGQASAAAADFARQQGPEAAIQRSGPLEQIDAILAEHNLNPVPNKVLQRREALRKYLSRKAKEDDSVDLTLAPIQDDLGTLHWQEMSIDEQSKLVDVVKALEKIAQQRNRFFRAADGADFQDKKQQALDAMAKNGPARRNAPAEQGVLRKMFWNPVESLLNEWATTARINREIDGHTDQGPMSTIYTHSIHDANNDQLSMQGESGRALAELRAGLGKSDFALSRRTYEPAVNQSLSHWARIMIALNWGNADNRARLLTGFKWSPEQVHTILAKLDQKDMRFVQGVLDHINSYWPLIKAKMERVTGVAAEKVDAVPIIHETGTYRGGYFPIAYDPTSIARDMLADMEAKSLRSGARMVASTRRGHEQARTEAPQGARLLLDPAVVGNHIQQVTHDLAYHETVLDLNRFLRDRDIHDEIVSRYGNGVYRTYQNQIRDLAAGQQFQRSAFGKLLEGMRVNVNLASRGFNLMTAAQQLAGFPQALGRVGPRYFMKAFGVMLHQTVNLESCFHYVDSKSIEMAGRSTSRDKTVSDSMGGLSVTGGWKRTIVGAAMWPWMKAFQLLDTHTWIAAHLKAIDEGATDAKAVAIADSTVAQVQGSGALKDLPELMRKGPFVQVFTGNMSWYNALWNQTAGAANRVGFGIRQRDIAHVMKGVGELTVLYGMLPIAWAACSAALTGKDQDQWQDPGSWAKLMGKEEAYGMVSEFPFLRELGSTIEDGSSYNGPQGLRSLEYIANAVRALQPPGASSGQTWTEKEETEHALKAFSKAAGVFGGLPATELWQVVDGVTQAERDGTNPLWHALVGPDQSKPRP